MDKSKELHKLVDDMQAEIERQDRRLEEYYILLRKIDKIAAGSTSKRCAEINRLIENHYTL